MSRINDTQTVIDLIAAMSDGNPGAINVMMGLMSSNEAVDPQDFMGSLGPIVSLDNYEIYGPSIWILYKDKCGQDTRRMLMLMRAVQLGLFPVEKLQAMAADQSRQINLTEEEFVALDAQVCEQLKEFARPEKAT